jgi:phosphoribosylanthranilate isomerase
MNVKGLRVKICGITQLHQGQAIAQLGASALGFICVPATPRYVTPAQLAEICAQLPPLVGKIGVFANAPLGEMVDTATLAGLTGIQLHSTESVTVCQQLRQALPHLEIIKALRIRTETDLDLAQVYGPVVDALLLDPYHPQQLGGTGQTLNWGTLQAFKPDVPWLLAGGLNPENVLTALSQIQPNGIDLSSGVEVSPGIKDLVKVAHLFEQLRQAGYVGAVPVH